MSEQEATREHTPIVRNYTRYTERGISFSSHEIATPQAQESILNLKELTPEKAVQIVQERYPSASLESTRQALSTLKVRIETVYGAKTARAFEIIHHRIPQEIQTITTNHSILRGARERMNHAAQLVLDTIPKDPVDLMGQGQHEASWDGALCNPTGFITVIIAAGVNLPGLTDEQQASIIERVLQWKTNIPVIDKGEVKEAAEGVLKFRNFLSRHKAQELLLEENLNIAHAYSQFKHLGLKGTEIDMALHLLPSEAALVSLLVDSLVTLEMATDSFNKRSFMDYCKELSTIIKIPNNLEHLFYLDQYETFIEAFHKLSLGVSNHSELFFRAFLEARAAIWWFVPLCRNNPWFHSLKHRLRDKGFEILQPAAYLEEQRFERNSVAWNRFLPATDGDPNFYHVMKLIMPRAIGLELCKALQQCNIPGVTILTIVDTRGKSVASAHQKRSYKIEFGETLPPRATLTHQIYDHLTEEGKQLEAEDLARLSFDSIGITIMINLQDGVKLLDIYPYFEEAFRQLGLLVIGVDPTYAQDHPFKKEYQAVHFDLGIPENLRPGKRAQDGEPLLTVAEVKIMKYSPFASLFGASHNVYTTATKDATPDLIFYPVKSIHLVALANRWSPRLRTEIGEWQRVSANIFKGTHDIPPLSLSPEPNLEEFRFTGWTIADLIYKGLREISPKTAKDEILKELLALVYLSIGGHVCIQSDLIRPPSDLMAGISNESGVTIQIVSTVEDYLAVILNNTRRIVREGLDDTMKSSRKFLQRLEASEETFKAAAKSYAGQLRDIFQIFSLHGFPLPSSLEQSHGLVRLTQNVTTLQEISSRNPILFQQRITEATETLTGSRDQYLLYIARSISQGTLSPPQEVTEELGTLINQFPARLNHPLTPQLIFATLRRELILETPLTPQQLAFLLEIIPRVGRALRNSIRRHIIQQFIRKRISETTFKEAVELVRGNEPTIFQHPYEVALEIAERIQQAARNRPRMGIVLNLEP